MIWWIIQNTISAVVMAAVVTAICRFTRIRPAARHALWLLVLIKLVTPPLVSWPLSLPDLTKWVEEKWMEEKWLEDIQRVEQITAGERPNVDRPSLAPPAPRGIDAFALDPSPVSLGPERRVLESLTFERSPNRNAIAASQQPRWTAPRKDEQLQATLFPRWQLLVGAAWLVGVIVVAMVNVVRILRMSIVGKTSQPAPKRLQHEVNEAARELGVRPPTIVVSTAVHSPVVWALGRAKLICPPGLLDELPATARRGVIIHELAHLRRRDHWVGWLELMAACLWWWNPLSWHVRHQVRENAELACDAWAVGVLPEEGRRAYAEALVAVYEFISEGRAPIPAVGMGLGSRRAFERRLTMILRECVPYRMPRVGFVAIAVLAVLLLPAWAQDPQSNSDETVSGEASSASLGAKTTETPDANSEQRAPAAANPAAARLLDLQKQLADLTAEVQRLRRAADVRALSAIAAPATGGARDALTEQLVLQAEAAVVLAQADVSRKNPELEQVRAQQAEKEALLRLRRSEYERIAKLADAKSVDTLTVEKAKYNLEAAKAGLDGARAAIKAAEAQVAATKAKLNVAQRTLGAARARFKDEQAARSARQGTGSWRGPPPPRPKIARRALAALPSLPPSAFQSETITLARADYLLPAAKAQALASFLKEHVAPEVETKIQRTDKYDADVLVITITTTPQAQNLIGQFIGLMQGRGATTFGVRPASSTDGVQTASHEGQVFRLDERDRTLSASDQETGKVLWRVKMSLEAPATYKVDGAQIQVKDSRGRVFTVDTKTGQVLSAEVTTKKRL